jgi:hypothetical protein
MSRPIACCVSIYSRPSAKRIPQLVVIRTEEDGGYGRNAEGQEFKSPCFDQLLNPFCFVAYEQTHTSLLNFRVSILR